MTSEVIIVVLLSVALYIILRHWPETKEASSRQQLNVKKPQEEDSKPIALKSGNKQPWWSGILNIFKSGKAVEPKKANEPILRHAKEESSDESEVDTLIAKAEGAQRKGDFAQAEKMLVKAASLEPKNPKIYSKLGIIYLEKGENWDEAEQSFKQAIKHDSGNGYAHNNLGLVLYNKEKFSAAASEYEKAIQIDEKIASRHINLGLAYMSMRQFVKAESAFKRAAKIDPGNNDYKELAKEAGEKRKAHQR